MSTTKDNNKKPKDNQARNAAKNIQFAENLRLVNTPIRSKRTISKARLVVLPPSFSIIKEIKLSGGKTWHKIIHLILFQK